MTTIEAEPTESSIGSSVLMELDNVTVRFGMDRGESRVLDQVNLDIHQNEILGVVGESGSGKSMLASSLLDAVVDPGVVDGNITYYPPDSDSVDVLDLSKSELKEFRWEEVAMVFQGAMSSFNPVRSIKMHFVETLSAHDENVEQGLEHARELLSDLYLDPDHVLEAYPHELSGGMKQRVLIALSLVLDPKLLVMDEPTAALDLLMQRSIVSLMEKLKRKYDLTILFITHDLPLVAGLADRLAVMYAFDIVEIGPSTEILRHSAHPYTRALLKSTPNLTTSIEDMRPIKGSSPDPVNAPDGCSYHPRCPMASHRCEVDDPEYYQAGTRHETACHFWDEVDENIAIAAEHQGGGSHSSSVQKQRSDDPVVSIQNVDVHFDRDRSDTIDIFSSPDTVVAVDDVTLDIYENDAVVLVGESGCGKTTLGKAAVGIQEPTAGSVTYRGQDIWGAKRNKGDVEIPMEEIRRALQMVHQDPDSALNSTRRVRSILADPLKRWNKDLNADDRFELLLGMLEYVGMAPPEDYIERYPHQLSGGEKQRVALVRAMLLEPDLILADEAVSALDVSLRVEMMDLMIELQKMFDTSFLFISHDLSNARYLAERMGGRIAVMYLGEIVEIGTASQIINDPRHPYTKALRWATPDLESVGSEAVEEAPIRKIDVPDPVNPPTGCRYHTRCPEAREVCRSEAPPMFDNEQAAYQETACFREDDDHEYWNSPSLE